MAFSIREISVSPPGEEMNNKGFGWSRIFIHLNDEEIDTYPNVTVEATVPYSQDQTIREAREAAYNRAKAMLRFALENLEKISLEELDKAARKRG